MRYKINLTDSQDKEVEALVNEFTNLSIYDEYKYKYISIELTKTFISKRLNPGDKEMSRVLVDCFIVESDRGKGYVYKEDILYNELLKFMTPYIREYKIDKIL
jgi:hypothetical protein